MELFGLTFITFIISTVYSDECTTPNNEKAKCISLYSCPVLIKGLATGQEEQLEFFRKSNCGGTGVNPLVCCGTASNFIKIDNSTPDVIYGGDLLPSTKICGLQHSDDYFHNESQTVITEFPWLALIEHEIEGGEREFVCSGSLINNRYVLTSVNCIIKYKSKPIGVRLGEYSIQNTTDCTDYLGESECSHPAKDYAIDSITVHPEYNIRTKINNIALIRLNNIVEYSDYIRPICLSSSTTNSPKVGDFLSSSGWGKVGFEPTDIKKKIQSKVISNEECQSFFNTLRNIRSPEKEFCVVEEDANFTLPCQSDSGAPVIYKLRAQWYQEGVVSFGIGCGYNQPSVLSRVRHYVNWIVENIKP